ncbi:hypothetical protein J6590_061308 [Homalodisca vitripennis]|nr:hypothetical protein J6590_061308 [Homalodisca vitripennis]
MYEYFNYNVPESQVIILFSLDTSLCYRHRRNSTEPILFFGSRDDRRRKACSTEARPDWQEAITTPRWMDAKRLPQRDNLSR